MTTPYEVRRYAWCLPDTMEATHFRLPALRGGEQALVALQERETFALPSVDEATAVAAATHAADR